MKKLVLLSFTSFLAFFAQGQVTSLFEDFNVTCATIGQHYPLNWSEWNVIAPTTALAWNCTPLGGRWGTPGTQCNSYYGGMHHIDTAWLFTPQLDLSGYADSVYLRFDSRYDVAGARLQILHKNNYYAGMNPDTLIDSTTWQDFGERLSPFIGPDDSAGWVTHYVNLTSYKSTPLYVAFRYTSTATTGGAWTIDNVNLTPWGLSIHDAAKDKLGLTILGTSTSSKITFSCKYDHPGDYDVTVYDNMGKIVSKSSIHAGSGTQTNTLANLNLTAGMYLVKVGNGSAYAVAKTIVE